MILSYLVYVQQKKTQLSYSSFQEKKAQVKSVKGPIQSLISITWVAQNKLGIRREYVCLVWL
jgi:maltodextrin utilization protein YvdJ